MAFMLSFTRGRKIAIALDSDDKTVFTIHITKEEKEPDVSVDDISELIDDSDIDQLRKGFKLGRLEVKLLKKALTDEKVKAGLSEKLKAALAVLQENAQDKLKREINFADDDRIKKVLPLIGARDTPYDRSIAFIGPSESGKTYLAKQIIKHDIRKRPVIVFSKIDDDASLRELKSLRCANDKRSRLIQIPLHCENDLMNLPMNTELEECLVLFDDVDSFPEEQAQFLREYRNSILESGRHHNITCLSTSHVLLNRQKTKVMLNECELLCLFPGANKQSAFKFLQSRFGLRIDDANNIIAKCIRNGRTMTLRQSCPNLIIHDQGVMMI